MSHHHHHHHDEDERRNRPEKSALSIYWRLMRTFALKHWFRLFLGVFAGLLIGGTMAATLRVMDIGLNVFESGLQEQPQQAEVTNAQPSQAPQEETTPTANQPKVPKEIAKRNKLFHNVNRLFAFFGVDIRLTEDSRLDLKIVIPLLLILFGFFLLNSVCDFFNKYFLRWVGTRVVTDVRIALFNHLQKQSLSFFHHNPTGKLISLCFNDVGAIEHVIRTSVPEFITSPILILASVQFIVKKLRELELAREGWLVLVILPFCVLPIILLSQVLKRYEQRVLHRIAEIGARMLENFSGIQVVKSFHREEFEKARFSKESESFFRALKKAILADTFIQPSLQLSALAVATVFIFACCYYHVSLGSLAIIGFAANVAYKPLKELAKFNADLQKSAAAAERIFHVLDTDTSLPVADNPVRIDNIHDGISFQDISFQYEADQPLVLSDISFDLKAGKMVALVGQTGSGKSTIASLLARFYDPTQGRITIDGHDLRELEIESFRRLVGIVSQDTFLFNDTLAANIRYGKLEATDEEIAQAAAQANATEFIESFPDGYNHVVGERGNALSGGQKQRIAIARAIIKNPPILILDEATSALDSVTEHLVQDALNNVMKDRTVLAIAHRLSTIMRADLILVMDNGRIVERGTHQELYDRNGVYRRLCDIQFAETADV